MTDRTLAVLENLHAIAVIVDRQGTVLAWTREFGELASHPSHDIRGHPLWEFASPDHQSSLRRALIETANDRQPRQADALMSASGGQRWVAWACSFMSRDNDDSDDSIVCWGREVTAREQELSAIYEHVPGILFYIAVEPGGEFRFRSMSRAGAVATGEHFAGALVSDVIPPASRDLVLSNYREAIRTGQTVRWKESTEYPTGRKVGEVAVTPLYDANGTATHLIGIVHDITEQERLQEALRQREERLAFILRLNDALRPLRDPVEIQNLTVRLVGEHLRVNGVIYFVIDGDDFIVTTSYDDGTALIRSRWPMATVGSLLEAYKRGEPVTVSDIRTDPRFTAAERAKLSTQRIVALLRVMLRKEDRWVATFGVNSSTPRNWTRDEIELIEEAAERMWSAAERACAETALRESQERLRLVLDASAAGSWTRDPDAEHVDWDEGFRRLYGFAPDEPAAFDKWLGRVHEDDRQAVLALLDEAAHPTRDEWDITFRIVRPDGTVSWIQSMGRVERDRAGTITRLAGLELDVTARRRAEETLQARRDEEHTRELRLLLETAAQGIASVNARGLIVTANRALETMFGWQSGELIGQSIEQLVPSLPVGNIQQQSSYFVAPLPRLIGGGLDLVGRRRDGSTFPVEVSLSHVPTADGGRAIAFVTDITERRQAALALQERTVELERRSAQLSRLASELTLAEQHTREQLAKTLHDGLQQLLVSTAMNLDRLTQQGAHAGNGTEDPLPEVKGQLAEAIDAARSLSYELFPPVLERSGLPAALAWLADWNRKKYGLEVELHADPLANSDRKDIRTLLLESVRELLFNAVKHARVDRVTVDLTREPNDKLHITVSDQGVGFDPVLIETQTDQIGWGLFSIRERLTLLGGRFEVESAPGRGSKFVLTVPRAMVPRSTATPPPSSPAAAEAPLSGAIASASPRALKILLVDDHAAMRKALRRLLQARAELQIVGEAADGFEAIAQARALLPDVVVMDVSMPEMDGIEATRRIRAEFRSIQILGLSMYPRTEKLHSIEQAGAQRFFVKGADTQRLVDHLLSMHKATCGAAFIG
jgi:PAS domain S-box-containing protein